MGDGLRLILDEVVGSHLLEVVIPSVLCFPTTRSSCLFRSPSFTNGNRCNDDIQEPLFLLTMGTNDSIRNRIINRKNVLIRKARWFMQSKQPFVVLKEL